MIISFFPENRILTINVKPHFKKEEGLGIKNILSLIFTFCMQYHIYPKHPLSISN